MVTVRREELSSPVAQKLINALNAELMLQYPDESATHFRLDACEVADGSGAFVVAYRDAAPVGCGAVRRLDGACAELKRMYVVPEARGEGIGRKLLTALEAEARKLGVQRLVLETGTRQLAALGLYRCAGFRDIELFGEYVESPATSICMAKELG
ncbi:MAG TPA: GNAT family N-acetyltransferase [Thermoanaerobaculia bacterium]|nr:GNAT family N-acetyltransferase [Thermoanaerobaculia bacterium]